MVADIINRDKDYTTKAELRKVEQQKKIIYQKIAIMLSNSNLYETNRAKLEKMLRKNSDFSKGELDLIFGKSDKLQSESKLLYIDINKVREASRVEESAFERAKRDKRNREELNKPSFSPQFV